MRSYYDDYQFEDDISDKYAQLKGRSSPSRSSGSGGGDCFIATAAYGTSMVEEINILRRWRDESLLNHSIGIKLVNIYYKISPSIAKNIQKSEYKRFLIRTILTPFIRILHKRNRR